VLMKKKKVIIACLFLFFVVMVGSVAQAYPFKVGEKLTYEIKFFGFVIGEETLEVKDIVQVNGHSTYLFVSTIKTVGFASLFYHFDEKIKSFVDIDTLYLRRLITHSDEGTDRSEEIRIDVNLEQGVVVIEKKPQNHTWRKKFSLPILDGVSLIYWLRAHDLKVGKKFFVSSFIEDDGMRKLEIEVLRKEEVHTFSDSFSTFLCSEVASTGRRMWFSDDERCIPIKIQAEASFGVITAYLSKIELVE